MTIKKIQMYKQTNEVLPSPGNYKVLENLPLLILAKISRYACSTFKKYGLQLTPTRQNAMFYDKLAPSSKTQVYTACYKES